MEIVPEEEDWTEVGDTMLVACAADGIPEAIAELARRDAEEAARRG